jgi:hypothetical protein
MKGMPNVEIETHMVGRGGYMKMGRTPLKIMKRLCIGMRRRCGKEIGGAVKSGVDVYRGTGG